MKMTPRHVLSSASTTATLSRILLIRHGDRYDYANPHWITTAKNAGALQTDPPLSALGHTQATETAQHLLAKFKDNNSKVEALLVSPYLRVIQTAVPTSRALHIPICIEDGLSEAQATPGYLPTSNERFAYFPEIDPSHTSHLTVTPTPSQVCPKSGYACEGFPGKYCQRMQSMASLLERTYHGKTVVCFSHAASVALVAALLKCSMKSLKFAPCGVYELLRMDEGGWELVQSGEGNEGYVSENSDTTFPWGFEERHFGEGGGTDYIEGMGMDYFVQTGLSNL